MSAFNIGHRSKTRQEPPCSPTVGLSPGYLGDCWLVSSFAAIAEYPDRVRSLFKQHELTADGRYDIRLYDPLAEEWQVVTIDDRLPYWQRPGKHGTLCFAKPTKENEFWTCLLEKAVAKFVKSYHRIDGGFEAVALEMLTGLRESRSCGMHRTCL